MNDIVRFHDFCACYYFRVEFFLCSVMTSLCTVITSRSMRYLGKPSIVTIHQKRNSSRNNLHFLRAMASSPTRSITDVHVPTPWGHLATKCWNLPSADDPRDFTLSTHLPVVCLHGWQDNAGSFDTLIPLLDKVKWVFDKHCLWMV